MRIDLKKGLAACALVLAVAVTTLGGCSTTDLFADKWNSWVGSDWREFADTNRFQNCQQTGATTVQCDTISWNIDGKGTITGWYR